MKKRILSMLLASSLALGVAAQAKMVKVGVIHLPAPYAKQIEEGLHHSLNAMGYIDGKTMEYQAAVAEPEVVNYEKNQKIAKKMLGDQIDVLVTIGTGASNPVWKIMKGQKVPQVFVGVTYPVQGGLIAQMSKATGENITGVSYGVPPETRLQIFRSIFPDKEKFKKLGFVHSKVVEQEITYVEELKKLQNTYGFELSYINFYDEAAKKPSFALLEKGAKETDLCFGWYQLDDFCSKPEQRDQVVALPLPIMGITSPFTDAGAIGGILTDHTKLGAQAAGMVKKILEGTPAGEIKPEEPLEYQLEINLKRAAELKIAIPEDIVGMAFRVVR